MTADSASLGPEPQPVMRPVPGQERLAVLDVLRGVALCGILFVNLPAFSGMDYPLLVAQRWPGILDRAAEELVVFFAEGKFYPLFSFLFGVGLAIQMVRAEAQGSRFLPLALRRLLVLLLIGVAHTLLVWDGDILRTYALLGGVLLLVRQRAPQTLVAWAVGCFLLLLAMYAVAAGISLYHGTHALTPLEAKQQRQQEEAEEQQMEEEEWQLYTQGTYAEMVRYRTDDVLWGGIDPLALQMFALFLLGWSAGRRRLFYNLRTHLPLLRKVCWWSLGVGLVGNAVFVAAGGVSEPSLTSVSENLGAACYIIGAPALGCFYASAIALLTHHAAWQKRLAPLAAVGRMALSNYLLQSLLCTTLFYHYGLGLFGRLRPVLGLPLTMGIFLLQMLLSVWWLRRFQFGPMEWLWRSLTYGQWQPMRRLCSDG